MMGQRTMRQEFRQIIRGLELLCKYEHENLLRFFGQQQGYEVGVASLAADTLENARAFAESAQRLCERDIALVRDPDDRAVCREKKRVIEAVILPALRAMDASFYREDDEGGAQ